MHNNHKTRALASTSIVNNDQKRKGQRYEVSYKDEAGAAYGLAVTGSRDDANIIKAEFESSGASDVLIERVR